MKRSVKESMMWLAVIAAGVIATGCTKTEEPVVENDAPIEAPPLTEATEPVAEPEPEEIVEAAPPPPKRLAPEGYYYLIATKSLVTDDGIIGLRPGTLIRQGEDGTFTADGNPIELQPNEFTNDLDVAARFAGADARAQAAIRQHLAALPPPPEPARSESASKKTEASSSRPASRSTANGAKLQSTSALGAGHTMTKGGWLFQKDESGEWVRVRPLK